MCVGKHLFHVHELLLKLLLSVHQLLNQSVFTADLFFENLDNVVLGVQHVLQVSCKSIEAIVAISLGFFLYDTHAALTTSVCAIAILSFVVDYVHSFYFYSAVYARHEHIWANGLVLFNVPSYALLLAFLKSFALCWRVFANSVVVLDLFVAEHLLATKVLIIANELHVL